MKKIIIFSVLVIAIIGLGIYLSTAKPKKAVAPTNDFANVPSDNQLRENMQTAGLDVLSEEGSVMHIHEHLDLIINGNAVPIPAEIGIGTNFISPMHTHDITGVLHIESPVQKDFTLGQFFKEWGVAFDDTHIDSYTADASHQLIVAVNGKPITNVANYVLQAHDEIEIWYGPTDTNPTLISSYAFAPGL